MQQLAQSSRDLILPYWQGDRHLATQLKQDQSPVTAADRTAEETLRKMIEAAHPEHGILGEEFGATRPDAEFLWILDPIDGTRSFLTGVPLFGTLIGLLHQGEPVLGCISLPVSGDILIGDGQTTTRNGEPVHVRQPRPLKEATLLTSSITAPARAADAAAWQRLTESVHFARTWGDCYGYALVATGKADIMADPLLEAWDLLPLIPVLRGAGAILTDWQGNNPLAGRSPTDTGTFSAVAAPPRLHRQVLDLLNT